jgi:hypothetical protein
LRTSHNDQGHHRVSNRGFIKGASAYFRGTEIIDLTLEDEDEDEDEDEFGASLSSDSQHGRTSIEQEESEHEMEEDEDFGASLSSDSQHGRTSIEQEESQHEMEEDEDEDEDFGAGASLSSDGRNSIEEIESQGPNEEAVFGPSASVSPDSQQGRNSDEEQHIAGKLGNICRTFSLYTMRSLIIAIQMPFGPIQGPLAIVRSVK